MKNKSLKFLAFIALMAITLALYPQLSELARRGFSGSGATPPSTANLNEAQQEFVDATILRQTLRYLSKNYYDTDALKPRALLREALLGLARNIPEVVVDFPDRGSRFWIEVSGKKKTISIPSLKSPEDIVTPMQRAFEFIALNYTGDTKFEDMEYVSVNGMLNSLDPHSALLPPKVFDEFKTQTEGEFGGIGIVIGLKDGELTVIAPLPNTPAWRAGLRAKDKIVQIGEEATVNMNLTEAVERLRGKVGTPVSLVVEREGAPAPIEVTLKRGNIKIESVQSKLITDPEGDIGVLRVKSFQEETLREMKRHLREMKSQAKNFKGLILDLRNNPGGLLNQAVDIADMFLKDGTIVLTVGAQNQVLEVNRAHGSDADEEYPVAVLVNEGSASASEIVAGALKNNNRGVILGQQTFGKGSVQSVYALKGGAALKITVAQYLTPGKASIQSVGITPDIKMIPMTVDKKRVDILESETFGEKDLKKHLESSLTQDSKPVYTLGFFQPKKPDEDEFNSEYTEEINTDEDFQLKFAHQMLLNAHSEDRTGILKEAHELLQKTKDDEFAHVIKALEGINVDWSLNPVSNGKPVAAVTLNILSSAGQVLKAGEEVPVELTVRNIGKAPFYRLIATTESNHFLLKNQEFIFGKINPGESRTWKVPIKVPASALRREDKVTFKFKEGNNFVPENFQSVITTQPISRPVYGYKMQIHEDGTMGSYGNGDQVVELGEKIVLKVDVENQGSGESKETIVNLKNLDGQGVFLTTGRVKLNSLKPHETKEARLSFRVDPSFKKDKVELELAILDNESQEILRDKISFDIGSKKPETAKAVDIQAGPLISLEKQPYPTKTHQNKISISGKVQDSTGLKDVSVFVGDYKAYLKTFKDQKGETDVKESDFVAAVPLTDAENNLITILARDKNNLTTRQSFYIYKE